MKLAIVGGRDFDDYDLFLTMVQNLLKDSISEIISGGASGADSLAERFADYWGFSKTIFLPEWDKYGKRAGFVRNQLIVDTCDMVVAFWDGESYGTADTIEKAKKAKKPTFIVYY